MGCYYCYRFFHGLKRLVVYVYAMHAHMRFYSISHQFRDDPKWLERDYRLIRLLCAELTESLTYSPTPNFFVWFMRNCSAEKRDGMGQMVTQGEQSGTSIHSIGGGVLRNDWKWSNVMMTYHWWGNVRDKAEGRGGEEGIDEEKSKILLFCGQKINVWLWPPKTHIWPA